MAQGTTSVDQASLGLLTDMSLLSEQWGTYPEFIEKYPTLAASSYILKTEASGAMKYTETQKYTHWEPAGHDLPYIQSTADVSGAAGADITITLSSDSHTDSGSRSPIAVDFVFRNETSGQVYQVVSVDKSTPGAHQATLRVKGSSDVPSVEAVDYLTYQGNSFVEEGSDESDGLYRESVPISGYCRIIRSDKKFTDLSMFEKVASPEGGYKFKNAQMEFERTRHFMQVQEINLMFGEESTNLGSKNSKAKGLMTQMKEYNPTGLASGATMDATFWEGAKRYFDAEGYSKEFDILMDTEAEIKTYAYLRSEYDNGAIIYQGPSESGRPMELASQFKSYNIDGLVYNFHNYAYFNASRTHGLPVGTAAQFSNTMAFIPLGTVIDERGVPMKRFTVRYQAESEGEPAIKTGTTGFYSPYQTSGEAVTKFHAIAYKGLQTFGLNGFAWAKLAS